MSLREKTLAAPARPPEKVSVAAWGGDVYVRGLSGAQRDAFEASSRKVVGKTVSVNTDNFRARLLVQCLYEGDAADAQRIFLSSDAEDLGKQPADVLEPLVEAALRLSGLSAQDVKEMAENFPPAPTAASPSV